MDTFLVHILVILVFTYQSSIYEFLFYTGEPYQGTRLPTRARGGGRTSSRISNMSSNRMS